MTSLRPFLLALALAQLPLAVGCATVVPHTEIETAPAAQGFDARAGYFKEHALQSVERDHLFLHGGERIYYPEDLLPAVSPGSNTAEAIAEHLEAREKVEEWSWFENGASYTGAAGLAVMLGGVGALTLLALPAPADEVALPIVLTGLIGGGGLLGVGFAGILVHGLIVGDDQRAAYEAGDRAQKTYSQSLSDHVGISVDSNGRLIDLRPGAEPAEPEAPAAPGEKDI